MKYLNILTACAGLATAVPTLNPRQTEIDEADKIYKSREMDEHQCNDYKWLCQETGNKEPRQLKECLRNTRIFCVDDDQCGYGLKCIRTSAPFALLEPGKCYRKKEQSQAVKRESASPAEDQTQAGEQESASRQTDVLAELDGICADLKFNQNKCAIKRLICIIELDISHNCIVSAAEDCVDDDQCGLGFKCEVRDFSERKICYPKDKKTQAGEQESASTTKKPTQDNKQDSTSPAKEPTQDNKQDSTSPAKEPTQAGEQDLASQQTKIDKTDKICQTRQFTKAQCVSFTWYCKHSRGFVELDQLNHCVEILGAPCKDDDQCGHGFECYKEDGVCDTKQSQAGEQESASSEQTQDKKQDSTSPAKEPTQDTTTNVATPSRPCTKKPINSSEKNPVVGAKSTQA
ncbi:hypothetical protein MANI_019044 [Metarhizium anisopliae]